MGCQNKEQIPTANDILTKSIQTHDPNGNWNNASFSIYIQEPRLGNPVRYSEVKLNNKDNSFELKRNREEHVSTHIVDKDGTSITYLDDKIETDTLLINKYRLNPNRNKGYQRFYKVLLGLPMSLNSKKITLNEDVITSSFNKEQCYKLSVILGEPLFSKHWNVFFSKENNKIVGLEMVFPKDPNKGERLVFEGEFIINNDIIIPRIRHWRELNDAYSGSDIILKDL